MGRQFSYCAFPDDLAEIEREVFQKLGGRLLIAQKRNARHHIEVAGPFPLLIERMGTESLFLLLAPPPSMEKIVFSDVWLDTSSSHLIEVDRSFIQDGKISEARFWYEPVPLVNGEFIQKPVEFINWASQVYSKTKKLLVRHKYQRGVREYSTWCGKIAKEEITAGRISIC